MDIDAVKVQQVMSNLISNALKFTSASGKIVVHVKKESFKRKPHLVISVRDNGVGIKEEGLPNVFNRFYQIDASDMRKSGGQWYWLGTGKRAGTSYAG